GITSRPWEPVARCVAWPIKPRGLILDSRADGVSRHRSFATALNNKTNRNEHDMGWGRTLLLGDIGNRLDIENTERDIASLKQEIAGSFRKEVSQDEKSAG